MMMNTLTHCHILYPATRYLTLISSVQHRVELLFTQRARLTGSLHSTNARFTELCTAAADEVRVPGWEEAYGTAESVGNRVHELILVSSDWERSTRFRARFGHAAQISQTGKTRLLCSWFSSQACLLLSTGR